MSIFQSKKNYITTTEWVKEHSYCIDSLTDGSMDDFQFLEPLLKNKRMVWLGENGHGIKEHNLLKTKLIHFLYNKMGFEVIAFESGLGECYSSNYLKEELTARELLDKSVFSLWKTKENFPLFELVKENVDFSLIGFDFQPSVKQSLFLQFLEKINIAFPLDFLPGMKKVEETSSYWFERIGSYKATRKKMPSELLQKFQEVQRNQVELISYLRKIVEGLEGDFVQNGQYKEYKVIQKWLENKCTFINQLLSGNQKFRRIRDQVMADNLEWICHELYPNEKIIIWAHNNHIFKNIKSGYKPMGSLMNPEFETQSYYLGLFMYQGEVTFNKKTIQKISKPPKKSLEDYMNHNPSSVSFLDFSKLIRNGANNWIFRNTVIIDSGIMPTFIVPKKQLDGIFFIKEVSPPHYL